MKAALRSCEISKKKNLELIANVRGKGFDVLYQSSYDQKSDRSIILEVSALDLEHACTIWQFSHLCNGRKGQGDFLRSDVGCKT